MARRRAGWTPPLPAGRGDSQPLVVGDLCAVTAPARVGAGAGVAGGVELLAKVQAAAVEQEGLEEAPHAVVAHRGARRGLAVAVIRPVTGGTVRSAAMNWDLPFIVR